MQDNKELKEKAAAKAVEAAEGSAAEVYAVQPENAPTVPENAPAEHPKADRGSWGEKGVTRKFLAIALASAVLLNVALSAGLSGVLMKKQHKGMSGMEGNGRPGIERRFDNDQRGKGGMMPPGGSQDAGQNQMQPPQGNTDRQQAPNDSAAQGSQSADDNTKQES